MCPANPLAPPELDHSGRQATFQPSVKLREKLSKLARWRIDPSSLEFSEDAYEIHGGNAKVLRAFLTVFPNGVDSVDGAAYRADKGLGPDVQPSESPEHDLESESNEEGTSVEEKKPEGLEEEGDNQEEAGDGNSSGPESGSETLTRKAVAVKKLNIGDDMDLEQLLG
ncbi:hypothetical protein FRC01_005664, partial [Tulasnella sp. 417]